ncbi:hypothetical protein [Candidatus Oleimmundimicrobium sp.]|uniref:hypothetical protein n=1 Tax=Candidatus Oleimmundimicrobium sp. TaxID=3060597 RepID=UPI00271CC9A8|nr:hypothetical protein [Candidatus Oleimmundimicrobium sp.]MDO8886874.1 hypothetical protein [Candidatus Oleimmundimicrobium sp.]
MKLLKIWRIVATAIWIGLSIAVVAYFSSGMIELFSAGKILQGIMWLILFIGVPLVLCFALYTLLLFPINYFSIRLSEIRKTSE